jgi:hypothetical protein
MFKVANSSWLQKQIQDKYNQTVPFSLNAIELKDFSPMEKFSDKDGIIRIVTYCDEREWKGFADIAQVISRLYVDFPDKIEWHAFGREHSRIKHDNSLAPYTIHSGISYQELAELYATSDIVICGSWYESFPLPPLEAMASGTAVITTTYGTEDYCFDKENCLCVSPRNLEEMYQAVKKLMSDSELRNSLVQAGLKKAQEFSWEKAVEVREKFLLDIHENRVDYNRFMPMDTGFVDGCGVNFMEIPDDLKPKYKDGMYIKQDGRYFIIQNQCKRLIANQSMINLLIQEGKEITEINEIECMRIPMGFTIWNSEDI